MGPVLRHDGRRQGSSVGDGIVLGCTEIELLIGQADSPVPVLPTIALHAEAAIEAAMGSET
ncbi:hypothetical protein ACT8ZV_00290 [Nocardioides sp. MAHUQ-72]|uniref:hypothetical protein n=1 Tax=unclassified Nocardioides TaxID=2615069 RepID=UPI0036180CAA